MLDGGLFKSRLGQCESTPQGSGAPNGRYASHVPRAASGVRSTSGCPSNALTLGSKSVCGFGWVFPDLRPPRGGGEGERFLLINHR